MMRTFRRPFGLLFSRSGTRLPQISVPGYSADGTRTFAIDSLPTPYFTIQVDIRQAFKFATFEISNPPPIRQYAMMAFPEPVFVNDTDFNDFFIFNTFKVSTSRAPTAPPAPPEVPDQPGQITLWGDESGDLLLWGDESGQLLLWGDTPT